MTYMFVELFTHGRNFQNPYKIGEKNSIKLQDLGHMKYFLGIEIAHSKNGIYTSRQKYDLELLEEYGLLSTQSTNTPLK